MINPSVHGWIDKFFIEQKTSTPLTFSDATDFYVKTRATGFIFGHNIYFDVINPIEFEEWTIVEKSKIGLLNTLYKMYCFKSNSNDAADFIEKAVDFYKQITPEGFNPLKKMLASSSNSSKLEKIIHERVQTNEDMFSKNFSHVITNALLFTDVLAFKKYLEKEHITTKYISKLEEIITTVVSLSLKIKTNKTKHDELLQKLFESSVRYNKASSNSGNSIETLDFSFLKNDLEKYYIIDLAGISLWSDEKVENEERYFLFTLGQKLEISDDFILKSIDFINYFIVNHKAEIPYFKHANPVKHFYDHTTDGVIVLINRNKKRLLKEISESKELMQLLAKSTVKDLDKEEKKKIKNQILDICKTIPSLTIFLLPGGSLLLPILIKFIPKMLPSAFNENITDD
ncbi:LETM1-related biofilm-associated protein [Flavobacterium capsici]|uniref:LETM1-related biofilm-associated protein n=1 Tax=Flavobacterium capsici TaxID=3075618 RepID=A0AA96J169_9FLAO|nr:MULTISPECIES: LETM1-related biofilm-associated protein [unclassified Flavobacterium]WNM18012.1 LETM1-related biofilm-associated protein [Flavobacterium sp. PMR2A8]WNM22064.1 LETM1-related biofilm-associated protein [Flavobacterium sp. PMTSA4]